MFEGYPKLAKLTDKTAVTLRLMAKKDQQALVEFFQRIPEEDRVFFRDDVSKPGTVLSWIEELDYERVLPLLALVEGRVVGDATLHRQPIGWTHHLGKVRLTIDPQLRRKGLGGLLIEELIRIGKGLKLERLVVELMGSQRPALTVFRRMGFEQAAVLHRHVKDRVGRPQDLVIMIHDLGDAPEPVSC